MVFDIDKFRRIKKNELSIQIKTKTTYNTKDKETIFRLRSSETSTDYVTKRITELNLLIIKRSEEVVELKEAMDDIESGSLDEEIENDIREANQEVLEKTKKTAVQKQEKKRAAAKNKEVSKTYWNEMLATKRQNREIKRNMNYEYNKYLRNASKLPHSMKKELDRSPNNVGLVFNGVIFYGKRKARQGEPYYIKETVKGGIINTKKVTKDRIEYYRTTKRDVSSRDRPYKVELRIPKN